MPRAETRPAPGCGQSGLWQPLSALHPVWNPGDRQRPHAGGLGSGFGTYGDHRRGRGVGRAPRRGGAGGASARRGARDRRAAREPGRRADAGQGADRAEVARGSAPVSRPLRARRRERSAQFGPLDRLRQTDPRTRPTAGRRGSPTCCSRPTTAIGASSRHRCPSLPGRRRSAVAGATASSRPTPPQTRPDARARCSPSRQAPTPRSPAERGGDRGSQEARRPNAGGDRRPLIETDYAPSAVT